MFLQKGEAAMKIQPTLDEVKTTAAAGRYDVLSVSCEILADICTPIEALKILKNVSTHCYLLESAQPSEKWGPLYLSGSGSQNGDHLPEWRDEGRGTHL